MSSETVATGRESELLARKERADSRNITEIGKNYGSDNREVSGRG
jgi:hypothetical protein